MSYEIVINNKDIFEFYKNHNIDPLYANTILIELLEKVGNISNILELCKTSTLIFQNILFELFPNSQINMIESCKWLLFTNELSNSIIIGNIEYNTDVSLLEVDDFITLCETKNSSGVLFSHNSSITDKTDFEIQITPNKNILLFIHNTNYDKDKIKMAIEILENLITQIEINDINPNILDSIKNECMQFMNQKNLILTSIQEFTNNMHIVIDELKLPNIDNYLSNTI
jgi:hypothetical protein